VEQNPFSGTNSRSSTQDTSLLLWKPNVHYCAHMSLPKENINSIKMDLK